MVIFHSYVSLPEGTPKWTFSGNAGCCEYWVLRLDSSWQEFPPLSVADLGSPSVAQQTDLDTLTNLGQYQIQIMELEYTQSSSSPSSSSSDYNPTHHHNERCQLFNANAPTADLAKQTPWHQHHVPSCHCSVMGLGKNERKPEKTIRKLYQGKNLQENIEGN